MTAGNRITKSALGAVGWLCFTASLAQAQKAQDLDALKARADALEKQLPVPTLTEKTNFDLSPTRLERFQKYLPKLHRKLSQRESVRLLILGDASTLQIHEGTPTSTFPGVFADQLANQFYYTGGVQMLGQVINAQVSTVILRDLSRPDSSILDAASILTSTARQSPVDAVLLCYGQNDAGMQPTVFARALSAAVNAANELGAEVILCSPWLPVAAESEAVLGLARPLADIQAQTASELNILYSDLGDLSRLLAIPAPQNQDVGQVFESIERTYREFFYQDAAGAFIPRPSLHRQLGGLLYKDLLDPAPAALWKITQASVDVSQPDKLTLTYTIQNDTAEPVALTVLPLIANGWKPQEANPAIKLEPKASQKLTISYTAETAPLALQEAILRMPLLISTGTLTQVTTLRAAIQPVAIVWGQETLFNQENTFLVGCQVVNAGQSATTGSWTAEFSGQTQKGNFDLQPQGTSPLNLQFNLPKTDTTSTTLPLKITVTLGDKTLTSTRQVTLTRNLGLDQAAPLQNPTADSQKAPITVTPRATAKALTFIFDLPSLNLIQEAPDGSSPAWQIELNLDARSYGKRLEQGSTAALLATGKSVDGPGKIHPVPAWAFGSGYAANFEPKQFSSGLSTSTSGRQITLTLPRSYLYLHEWALENGNSQLGLNLRLTLRQEDGYQTYHLPLTVKPAQDIESLAVLELAHKSTQRFTISIE